MKRNSSTRIHRITARLRSGACPALLLPAESTRLIKSSTISPLENTDLNAVESASAIDRGGGSALLKSC